MPASGTVCAVGRRIGIDIGIEIEIAVTAAATVREVEIGGGGIWICS
jgi:hypothetical protein